LITGIAFYYENANGLLMDAGPPVIAALPELSCAVPLLTPLPLGLIND
jgi:hypothetical protein